MSDTEVCSAAIRRTGIYSPCRNGFPQTGPCWGSPGVPICMSEKACAFHYPETGKPPDHMLRLDEPAAQPHGGAGDVS